MSETSNPNDPGSRPQRKPSRVPIYAALAMVGAGAILGLLRSQPSPDGPTPGSTPSVAASQAPAPDATLAATSSGPSVKPQLVIFVPDDNGQMARRSVALDPRSLRSASGDAPDVLATMAVNELMKATPETFPPGTKLTQPVKSEGGTPTLNFNRAFLDEGFWQGSARTLAALDSLALTVGEARRLALGESASSTSVRIMAEGKPIAALGEMDLSRPYEPSAKAPAEGAP